MQLPVEAKLKEKGIVYRLIPLTANAYTVADVVKFAQSNIDPNEICKTIVLCGKKSGAQQAVFLRGTDKLDFGKLKRLFGEEMAIATAEQVKESAGVEPGAVCPFLLTVPLSVDQRVLELDRVNCGSGHHLFGLEFQRADLARGADYTAIDASKTQLST
ncbi:YbaK/EbsC family protein [Candidatus Berkelbacteria bacterium]|nr:YbaK/EbsC family protein [Candidatus Berkelbacteria bacterium]